MAVSRRRRTTALLLLLAAGATLLAMAAAYRVAARVALDRADDDARHQVELYARGLEQRIDRYSTLPQVLALDPELRSALSAPVDAAGRDALNLKLERANRVTESSTLTLIDRDGIALAASNWRGADSNVGKDYAFRPYVQQGLRDGQGRFYGIGMTTNEPGYFLSQAIRDAHGRVIGLIVIKIALAALEREWTPASDLVLVADAHGVVFLASDRRWRYHALQPLPARDLRELAATRQYAGRPLPALRWRALETRRDGARLVRFDRPALAGAQLWRSAPVSGTGWRLHLLRDTQAATAAARSAALATGGLCLALTFLGLFVQQRRRLSALRQRSRAELEAVLAQHARELRSAQDGIVQAARDAETGLSRSLEHLPQGVVTVDAEQRLVAWNSRYVELFGFPPELLRVGRPIADLLRHNAQRGLLGPGPVDTAIERRLEHLRSGRPHLRESEKSDGTVLEIRGTPLPDGGFVTSYADITSYRNAARELRSLADALEHRIVERTADLEQARLEAETANRYKTRFVAAAVHDLLQPLNAARMFLSTLRAHLREPDTRGVADSVEGALAAQDAILNSLLDISRLEAGTQQVRIRDIAVGPLLAALAHDFGVLARARGLRLDCVATTAVVRSDEHLLRRVLQNLVSNAVRYTAHGRIVLGCRRVGDALRIEVHDTGPGIPPNRQREIFEEFRRLGDGGAGEHGAGLGLAIVKRIARLLDHRIGLRSRPGVGSVFSVTVPLAIARDASETAMDAAASPSEGDDASPLRQATLWHVDDAPERGGDVDVALRRLGCRVALTANLDTARTAARAGEAPDLVLLAVRAGAAAALRDIEALAAIWGARPAAILLADEDDDALRALAQREGFGQLRTPFRAAALRALMTQLLLRRG